MAVNRGTPPSMAGLCAGARGLADHCQLDGDALLVWYRTGGRLNATAARLHVARRAVAAGWQCTTTQAVAVIGDALTLVATRRAPSAQQSAKASGMRKASYLELRVQASAWLRASIMQAEWRHGRALG